MIFLTDEKNRPNACGLAYLKWFYNLKGPKFVFLG